ncbi:MAG TPA: hypothetical protein DDW94_07280 [Deltaproteobacteria bacterium]|nr:MAG: hypothetical protein A2Z79_01810 [Deltaproteobacteria bacterium GWA2_55_82]OGQ62569.1 MAG: hypothetical protein A3I81_08625 [Deltaproteobacteria bacterium RIFCSPLOWO2_02_FULL_55_12]OIJ74157.1 MAG: hypothetical protein A2V21_307710 [Deltaproteobacteria bacterium GWC2_55_46]HBG46777.1 hypothetical protein [Deltaproteobacteria bacterium]HCY11214.1 hypothetical protein [Deltaproteobacteria bacterium]
MEANAIPVFIIAYVLVVVFSLIGDVTARKEGALKLPNIGKKMLRSAAYLALIVGAFVAYTWLTGQWK